MQNKLDNILIHHTFLTAIDIDGIVCESSHFHIDALLKNEDLWFDKSIEFYPLCILESKKYMIPWETELIMDFKYSRKKWNLKDLSKQYLIKHLINKSDSTPPSFNITACNLSANPNLIKLEPKKYDFIPAKTDCYFNECWDKYDRCYRRALIFKVSNQDVFKFMVLELLNSNFSFYDDLDYVRDEEKQRMNNLKQKLKHDPKNIKFLTELGILLLLTFDFIESEKVLKKVIELDFDNTDALFWLAIYYFYCLADIKKAKKLISDALLKNPKRADCFILMYSLTWNLYKSQEDGIQYILSAKENAPDWIMPKIQYFRYLCHKHIFSKYRYGFERCELNSEEYIKLAKKELKELSELLKDNQKLVADKNDIIQMFYSTYIAGKSLKILKFLSHWKK